MNNFTITRTKNDGYLVVISKQEPSAYLGSMAAGFHTVTENFVFIDKASLMEWLAASIK